MLRAFGHPVATCYDMLSAVDLSVKIVNNTQHVTAGWPNARNRFAGALRSSNFEYEHDLTPVLSTAVSPRPDLDCEEGVLVPKKASDRE